MPSPSFGKTRCKKDTAIKIAFLLISLELANATYETHRKIVME